MIVSQRGKSQKHEPINNARDDGDDDDDDDEGDLHNAVPIVASCHAEQRQKSHAEVTEVGVVTQSFARMGVRTFCTTRVNKSTNVQSN